MGGGEELEHHRQRDAERLADDLLNFRPLRLVEDAGSAGERAHGSGHSGDPVGGGLGSVEEVELKGRGAPPPGGATAARLRARRKKLFPSIRPPETSIAFSMKSNVAFAFPVRTRQTVALSFPIMSATA